VVGLIKDEDLIEQHLTKNGAKKRIKKLKNSFDIVNGDINLNDLVHHNFMKFKYQNNKFIKIFEKNKKNLIN
jgi:hypothetical protein